MTVSTVVDHNDYSGNGVTTSFPYTFRIFKKTDLAVSVVDLSENITVLVLDTDYTVTNAGGYNGGNVVLTAPLATGWQISIAREIEPTQETDLRNQGKFFAETHENVFDKLTMLIQQGFSRLTLALRKPSSIANWYDGLGNYIRNIRDPRYQQDAATKNYVDASITSNTVAWKDGDKVLNDKIDQNQKKTLRVPESYIPEIAPAATRSGMLLGFNDQGVPVPLSINTETADLAIKLASSTGTSLIGHSAGDLSFFSYRTLADELKQTLWFDDFKGNNDDEKWSSLAAYVSTAVVTSVCVMFSARKHIFSSNPATLTKPFELHGLGAKNTVLQFNDCDGIRGDLSGYAKYCQSKIAHMSIVANSINSRTGVYFKGFQTFSPHDSSLVIEGVSIYGIRELDNATPIASEWAISLHLDNADEISISDLFIAGSQNNVSYATRTTSKGIYADTVTGFRISTSSIFMCHEGIEVVNQSEGLIFDGLTIVAVDTGILLRNLIGPANNHVITNTHVSAYTKGIEIRKLSVVSDHAIAVFMSNLFLLEREGNAGKPMYTAIEAYVTRSALDSITIQSNNTNSPNRRGIVLPNQDITISNISAVNVGTLLYIDPVAGSYVYYSNIRTKGDLTAEIGGSPQFAVGAGLGSTASSAEYTVRCDAFRTTDLQGRSQYESSGSRHMFGGGRQNASVFHDFRTFPGGTAAYDGRILFTGGNASVDGKADMSVLAGSVSFDGNISPRVANAVSCGTSAKPWSGGYTQTAFTVTSDERYKSRPLLLARGSLEFEVNSDQRLMQMPYSDNILDAWGEVDFVQFQYIDRIEAKGDDGARWHVGVIAQRAQEAFIRHGLDPHRFAFFCYDPEKTFPAVYETVPATYEVVPAEYDGNGLETKPEERRVIEPEHQKLISESYTVGEKYGIRYEEALVIEAALQRRNATLQKEKTTKLEEDIKAIYEQLKAMESR